MLYPQEFDVIVVGGGHAGTEAALEHRVLCALLDGKMQREQEFLQLSARQRYASLLEQHPEWADRIALKHLASYLGVTDVSLSRLRSEMGLIKG